MKRMMTTVSLGCLLTGCTGITGLTEMQYPVQLPDTRVLHDEQGASPKGCRVVDAVIEAPH